MKKSIFILTYVLSFTFVNAQNNTIYDKLKDKAIDKAIDKGLDYAYDIIIDALKSSNYQNSNKTSNQNIFNKKYTGSVNMKYHFHLELLRNGENLSGILYYDKYKKNMRVAGVIDNNNNFIFYEYWEGKLTGIYTGFIYGNNINGIYTSGDGKRSYTYKMYEN